MLEMPGDRPTIFEIFKQESVAVHKEKPAVSVFFQVIFTRRSARLLTVDSKGTEIRVDYRDYSGNTRNVLKAIDFIKDKNRFEVKWNKEEVGIDLSDNSFLLWQLRRCDNLVDYKMKPVLFADETGELRLTINENTQLECRFSLLFGTTEISDIRFINESCVFGQNRIYFVQSSGIDFLTIKAFETLIFPNELEKYLSLLFSYCENIDVQYKDYRIVKGPSQKAKASIIFERVTPDLSLYMRVTASLPGYDPDFFENYDISRIVSVDSLERLILVCELDREDINSLSARIERILQRLKRESVELDEAGYYKDGNFFILDNPLSEEFINNALPHLVTDFIVFGAEKLEAYNVNMVKPDLQVSINHGIDFLEGSADLVVNGQAFSLFEALHQFRRNSYIQLNDGSKAILDRDYVEKLERLFRKKDDSVEISFFDLPLIEDLLTEKVSDHSFELSRQLFNGFIALKDQKPDLPLIRAELRPYQIEGFKWLKYLYENSMGGCLADDMGLGKTLQAITLLSHIYPSERDPSLIIVPKSLIFNWQKEIERFNPELRYYLYYGPSREIGNTAGHQVILTTYATVRNDIERLLETPFHCVILDESQYIKNVSSQISRAVLLLKAKIRLALSGTPIENNLAELYALFRFLNPAMFGSFERFNRLYLSPIQQYGNREAAEELKKKIYPFILRRLKKEVLEDLPDKVEQVCYIEMSQEQRRFYEQRRSFYYDSIRYQIEREGVSNSQFYILQAITVLRQIASIPELKSEGRIISPKRDYLQENMLDAIANGHKILLFANFLGILDYLAEDLNQRGIDFETLTGATRNREIPVNRFQTEDSCKVFLMTLKAGGQGLNLTAADFVYVFDPWWNLAAENQAIDRSHRIGQDKTVFSYKLIMKDTIEEKIVTLQEKKRSLFENIISSESISFKYLEAEDIDYLMS